MAKKQTEKDPESKKEEVVETKEVETKTPEETTVEAPKEEETVETKVVEEPKPEPKAKEQDIPSDVLKILAVFPEMEFLYVGKGGGIWRNGTPECIRGKAVLYKNPYFIKNKKTEK